MRHFQFFLHIYKYYYNSVNFTRQECHTLAPNPMLQTRQMQYHGSPYKIPYTSFYVFIMFSQRLRQ